MKTKKKTIKSLPRALSITPLVSDSDYDTDFCKWAKKQARFLKGKEFEKLDIEHLIEEIEDLSKRERDKLISYLENLLMHLLKVRYQSEKHTSSWDFSIKGAEFKAKKVLEDNPSLKPKLKAILNDAYYTARLMALKETGLKEKDIPESCPWELNDIFPNLEKKYL